MVGETRRYRSRASARRTTPRLHRRRTPPRPVTEKPAAPPLCLSQLLPVAAETWSHQGQPGHRPARTESAAQIAAGARCRRGDATGRSADRCAAGLARSRIAGTVLFLRPAPVGTVLTALA